MPYISVVAMWVLGIPGSTASLERVFSAAGRAITRRRPRLKPSRAAAIIYGHANVVRGHAGHEIHLRRLEAQRASLVQ